MLCAKYNLQSERTFETPCSSVNVKHDHWSTNICLTLDTSELWATAATLKMREKNKNKRYAYLSSKIEVSGSVYCWFLSLNSKTFTVIASLNCFKTVKSDESTPRIIQSLLVHWSQTNPTIASHAHVLGGSSRVHAPLRTRDKPLLTSAWETNPTTHLSIKPRWKLNGAGKVWDELSNYKTLLRVEWEIFTQRRVLNANISCEQFKILFHPTFPFLKITLMLPPCNYLLSQTSRKKL